MADDIDATSANGVPGGGSLGTNPPSPGPTMTHDIIVDVDVDANAARIDPSSLQASHIQMVASNPDLSTTSADEEMRRGTEQTEQMKALMEQVRAATQSQVLQHERGTQAHTSTEQTGLAQDSTLHDQSDSLFVSSEVDIEDGSLPIYQADLPPADELANYINAEDLYEIIDWNELNDEYTNEVDDTDDHVPDDLGQHFAAQTKPKKRRNSKKNAAAATQRKAKRKAGDDQLGGVDLDNIMGTNVFSDVAATAHLPGQYLPRGGATRADALRAIRQDVAAQSPEDKARDVAKLTRAIQQFDGVHRVKIVEGGVKVLGLKTLLHPYQVVGTGFMRQREKATGPNEAKGGILADTMGLGKTLTVLANIVNGQPKAMRDRRPTLVVASPALLEQWHAEIEKHVEKLVPGGSPWGLKEAVFYKKYIKMPKGEVEKQLLKQDIVLVSYHAVMKSFPLDKPPHTCTTPEQKQQWFRYYFGDLAGTLHRINWHRVVLDEAHAIKNFDSITSRACRMLKAKYYWAVTGTPVLNSITEFYPYLKLIRDPWAVTRANFEAVFCDTDDDESRAMLSTLLERIMLRRTHASKMFGSKLITLPRLKPCHDITVTFSPFEQKIYTIVRDCFIERIKKAIDSNDTAANKHRHIFTMLLRLRQLTGHILLIQKVLEDILTLSHIHYLQRWCKRITRQETDQSALQTQLQLMVMLEKADKNISARQKKGVRKLYQSDAPYVEATNMTEAQINELGFHGSQGLRPDELMKAFDKPEPLRAITARTRCVLCNNKAANPYITDCSHVYCMVCIERQQQRAALLGQDQAKCFKCLASFTTAQACAVIEEEAGQSDEDSEDDDAPKKRKRKTKAKASDWTKTSGPVPPSAKTRAMQVTVSKWIEEDPNVKIIIYSQFLPLLRIIGRICKQEKWTFVKYQGDMSTEARVEAIKHFSDPKQNIRIFLASLKCGGQGLNLTAASRVLLMDSWWNDSIEQQAFCRVYRIGQERETQLTRLIVQNTIDEHMFAIKDRKQDEIDPVMDGSADGNGDKGDKKVSLVDMLSMLGPVEYDALGHPHLASGHSNALDDLYFEDLQEGGDGGQHAWSH